MKYSTAITITTTYKNKKRKEEEEKGKEVIWEIENINLVLSAYIRQGFTSSVQIVQHGALSGMLLIIGHV